MADRFKETTPIRQTPLDTGGAAGMLSLSNKLENFQSTQRQINTSLIATLGQQAEERGEISGANVPLEKNEDGTTIAPKPKKKRFIGGVEIAAHNKALRASYLAGLSNDIKTGVNEIQAKNPDNLTLFNDAVTGYRKGVEDTVDPAVSGVVSQYFDNKITTSRLAVQTANIKKDELAIKGELQSAIDTATLEATTAAANGDIVSAGENKLEIELLLQQQFDAGYISKDSLQKYKRDTDREISEQFERRKLDTLSDKSMEVDKVDGIAEAASKIDKMEKTVPNGWTPDEWSTFIKSARTDLNHKKTVQKAAIIAQGEVVNKMAFDLFVENKLTVPWLQNAKFATEGARTAWLKMYETQTANAKAAKHAEETRARVLRNDLHAQEQIAARKAETIEEKRVDGLYANGDLTPDLLDASDLDTPTKRQYRKLMEGRAKVAKTEFKKFEKDIIENKIETRLGEWTPEELKANMPILSAREVNYWIKENKAVQDDPTNYRNNVLYRNGMKDLLNAKKNWLFIGGETTDLAEDNKNTQEWLRAVEQYKLLSAEPGADFIKILDDIKKPYIEGATKSYLDIFWETLMNPAAGSGAAFRKGKFNKKKAEPKSNFKIINVKKSK